MGVWLLDFAPTAYGYACTLACLVTITSLIKMRPTHEHCGNGGLDLPGARAALRARMGLHTKEGSGK